MSCDGVLCLNDRVIISPSLRSTVLADLQSAHLGVGNNKTNVDLDRFAKLYSTYVHKVHSK